MDSQQVGDGVTVPGTDGIIGIMDGEAVMVIGIHLFPDMIHGTGIHGQAGLMHGIHIIGVFTMAIIQV